MIKMIAERSLCTRMTRLIACCCAISLLSPSLATAEDFFISTQADFDTHRQSTFAPGDQILFARGSVFNGMFAPSVVGTANNPIRISTFGTGPRPIINNNGVIHPHPRRSNATVSAGVFLLNPDYVEIEGLEITNNNGGDQDDENLFGIFVSSEDINRRHQQIYIDNNYVHHVNGAVAGKGRGGIHVRASSPSSGRRSSYNDLRITNNVVEHIGGVGIATDLPDVIRAQEHTGPGMRPNAATNVYIGHNSVKHTGRNSYIIRDSYFPLIEHNISGYSSLHDKGHSFFNFNTVGAVFQYNEAYGNTGPADESDRGGFDADFNAIDTLFQYNYSHSNNYCVGIMKRPNAGVTIRYNLSVNDIFGVYFFGFENNTDLTNLHVYNNTHYFDATVDSPLMVVRERTPHNSTFNNIIFYSANAGAPGVPGPDTDNGVNVTFDTNAYFQFTAPTTDSNPLFANPQFFSPGAEPYDVDMEFGRDVFNGYRLTTSSPYVQNGVAISNNGGLDFWGQPLTSNTIGASGFDASVDLSPGATLMTDSPMSDVNSLQVVGSTPDEPGTGDDAATSLSQTFQIGATFELNTIFLGYEYDGNSDPNHSLINVEIFEVEDVGAAELVQGTSILTINGLRAPQNATNSNESAIVLDSPITLEATTGTSGYALRITNGGNPGFEWRRTGTAGGSVYAFGQAYEDGVEKFSGDRDFVLALSAEIPSGQMDLVGDFNVDGEVDCDDLDGYVGNLEAAVNSELAPLDLDNDGTISAADATTHITTLVQTSNGNTGTFPGDLNCDGEVDVLGDAFALVGNLGNAVTSYSQGDISFDGTVDVLGDAFTLIGNLGSTNDP